MRTLVYDELEATGIDEKIVDEPEWSEVERRIDALDGDCHTMVWLYDEPYRLVIVGPHEGRCAVDLHGPGGAYRYLVEPEEHRGDEVMVMAQEHEAAIPRRRLVPIELAKEAARSFLEGAHATTAGSWEEA